MKTELEEAAKKYIKLPLNKDIDEEQRYFNPNIKSYDAFIDGAKSDAARDYWFQKFQEQDKNKYSGEEVLHILHNYRNHFELHRNLQVLPNMFFEWFEQFSKLKNG
jgi:hypothetical protein